MSSAKPPTPSPYRRLLTFLVPYRFRILCGSLCTALSTLLDLLPDLLIGVAVDIVVHRQSSFLASWGITNIMSQLMTLGAIACVLWAFEAFFEYLYAYIWRNLAQTIQHDLRIATYKHVQELGMGYYEEATTGGLLTILNDDINQLERFFDVGLYKGIYLLTTLAAVATIFLYFAPHVALFAFLPLPIVVALVFYFRKKLAPRYALVRQRVAQLAHRITNNIMGITTIKSYTSEQHELAQLRAASQAYQDANRAAISLSAAFTPIMRMLIVIAFIATVVLGGWYVVQGWLPVGAYTVLVFQTQRLFWPVTELAEVTDLYERAMASLARVFSLLDKEIVVHDGKHPVPLHEVKGTIAFQNVTFSYAPHIPVFNNLSLTIKQGHTVAFVGATGSGKSTLIKLLLRFYDPQAGRITLDGIDISSLPLHDVRKAIALVSQDVYLFHGTVRENIAYGTFDASLEQVMYAARIAHVHDVIMSLPQGYDTVIGSRGQKLSGGQRQRISIARAVLKSSPIFILDEATSSVDNETEAAIQRSLDQLTKHHTVIVIAHRLSTICNADMIFVMGNGGIIESGIHEELLSKNGMYASLWRVQTGSGYEVGLPTHGFQKGYAESSVRPE